MNSSADSYSDDDAVDDDVYIGMSFTREMVKYDFKIINDNEHENEYCEWIGQYTIGNINIRGTRVWFRTNVARSYEADSLFFDNESHKKNFYAALKKGQRFPGDYCGLRSESLAEILNDLESKTDNEFKYYKGSFEKLMKILWKADKTLALNVQRGADIDQKNNNDILCSVAVLLNEDEDLGYESGHRGGNVWIIKENMKEKIIKELRQVLKTCNQHDVLFEWV